MQMLKKGRIAKITINQQGFVTLFCTGKCQIGGYGCLPFVLPTTGHKKYLILFLLHSPQNTDAQRVKSFNKSWRNMIADQWVRDLLMTSLFGPCLWNRCQTADIDILF